MLSRVAVVCSFPLMDGCSLLLFDYMKMYSPIILIFWSFPIFALLLRPLLSLCVCACAFKKSWVLVGLIWPC